MGHILARLYEDRVPSEEAAFLVPPGQGSRVARPDSHTIKESSLSKMMYTGWTLSFGHVPVGHKIGKLKASVRYKPFGADKDDDVILLLRVYRACVLKMPLSTYHIDFKLHFICATWNYVSWQFDSHTMKLWTYFTAGYGRGVGTEETGGGAAPH